MLVGIIFLFVIVAFIGLFLITAILNNKRPPRPAAMIHGSIAIISILLLTVFTVLRPTSYLLYATLGLFILAALGGITMFMIDVNKKPVPKMIAIIHPIVALTAFAMLVTYLIQNI